MKTEDKIKEVLDYIRPILIGDGGDVEFVKFEDGKVYIKLLGHCATCPMNSITLKDGIESSLINEIDEVTEVIAVD